MKTENTNIGIEEVLKMAKTSLSELAIAGHETGYTMLSAHVDENGNIDDAEKTWNPNEQWGGGGWIMLYRTGTGENHCDCEACANGDNPAEWVPENNNDELDCVADRINDKLKDVGAEFAQAQFEREQRNG